MHTSRVTVVLRVVLGLVLVLVGLNKLFHFMPTPPPTPEMQKFLGALAASGYLIPLVAGVEAVVGILLITDRFVPLALVVLAPISVNIVGAHLAMDPAGIAPAAMVAALNAALAIAYRDRYEAILRAG
jgi:uncharacterized membrane protein YphA (DoxX/SURF4 family)